MDDLLMYWVNIVAALFGIGWATSEMLAASKCKANAVYQLFVVNSCCNVEEEV
jgi:hypothetical protein